MKLRATAHPKPIPPHLEAAVRSAAADGLTRREAAERIGISYDWVSVLAERIGVAFSNGRVTRRQSAHTMNVAKRKRRSTSPPSPPSAAERHWASVKASLRW